MSEAARTAASRGGVRKRSGHTEGAALAMRERSQKTPKVIQNTFQPAQAMSAPVRRMPNGITAQGGTDWCCTHFSDSLCYSSWPLGPG